VELKDFVKATIHDVMDAIAEVNLERQASGKRGTSTQKCWIAKRKCLK
jgi:hypothetical protein